MSTSCPVRDIKYSKMLNFWREFYFLNALMSNFCLLKGNTVPGKGTNTLVPEMDKFTIIYQLKYDLL